MVRRSLTLSSRGPLAFQAFRLRKIVTTGSSNHGGCDPLYQGASRTASFLQRWPKATGLAHVSASDVDLLPTPSKVSFLPASLSCSDFLAERALSCRRRGQSAGRARMNWSQQSQQSSRYPQEQMYPPSQPSLNTQFLHSFLPPPQESPMDEEAPKWYWSPPTTQTMRFTEDWELVSSPVFHGGPRERMDDDGRPPMLFVPVASPIVDRSSRRDSGSPWIERTPSPELPRLARPLNPR